MRCIPGSLLLLLSLVLLTSWSSGGGTTPPPTEPPTITGITPGTISGPPGSTLELQLRLDGQADEFSWSFAAGAYPRTSRDAAPKITLTRPGSYNLSMTAQNQAGASPPFAMSYEVSAAALPSWQELVSPDSSFGDRLVESTGRPALISNSFGLRLHVAATARPTSVAHWNEYVLADSTSYRAGEYAILPAAGAIYLLFERDNRLKLARSAILPPDSPDDWTISEVADLRLASCAMTEHMGQLVIAARRDFPYEWVLLQTLTLPPSGPDDWKAWEDPGLYLQGGGIIIESAGELLEILSLSREEPDSALSYFSAPGAAPLLSDWTRSVVSPPTTAVALGHATGRTYAVYHQPPSALNKPLLFAYAASERPIGADQWTSYQAAEKLCEARPRA